MIKVKVRVTREDIRIGKRKNCTRCPVARAVKRVGLKRPSIYPNMLCYCSYKGRRADLRLPRIASAFIRRFDDSKPVKPFSFIANVNPWRR